MKFFYASGARGLYGKGYFYQKFFNFPDFPFVTKTITPNPRRGNPFAISFVNGGVINKNGLKNPGIFKWLNNFQELLLFDYKTNLRVVSLYGTYDEVLYMINIIKESNIIEYIYGFEINFSCPNACKLSPFKIPKIENKKIYLKLNATQNINDFDLTNVTRIHLNSIPIANKGGISGRINKEINMSFIDKNIEYIDIAAASFTSMSDIKDFSDLGCKYFQIGSAVLTNPRFVENLRILNGGI